MQFGARRLRRFIVRRLEDQGTTQQPAPSLSREPAPSPSRGFLRSPSRSGLKAAIPGAVSECAPSLAAAAACVWGFSIRANLSLGMKQAVRANSGQPGAGRVIRGLPRGGNAIWTTKLAQRCVDFPSICREGLPPIPISKRPKGRDPGSSIRMRPREPGGDFTLAWIDSPG